MTTTRPPTVTDEHLKYLDTLRDSAKVNMAGASPYLMKKFGISRGDARIILTYWMVSFGERHLQEKE